MEIIITSLFRKLTKVSINNFKIDNNGISGPLETCKILFLYKSLFINQLEFVSHVHRKCITHSYLKTNSNKTTDCSFNTQYFKKFFPLFIESRAGGSVMSVSDLWPGGCEFDLQVTRTFFRRIFASHLSWSMCEKQSVALEEKVVLVLVWESQETHVRHRLPWYDFCCLSGVKPQHNKFPLY